jgi:hypothetical protein
MMTLSALITAGAQPLSFSSLAATQGFTKR